MSSSSRRPRAGAAPGSCAGSPRRPALSRHAGCEDPVYGPDRRRPQPMSSTAFLAERLSRAGIRDVVTVEPVSGGLAALAGIARREGAPPVFVKAFAEAPDGAGDAFVAEAEGLAALRELGGLATPEVIVANREVLVLSLVQPRPPGEAFWEQFAHALAHLHTSTVHPRFGWHRDNWL